MVTEDTNDRRPSDEPGPRAAYADALRMLARRPLTSHEVRHRLSARGHADPVVEVVLERLRGEGYVDDEKLAVDYIVLRAERLGHGRRRLVGELERRGVEPDLADRCWRVAMDEMGLDPPAVLRREAERRVSRAGGGLDARSYRRVYNALLRAGHDAASVAAELEPYRESPGRVAGASEGGTTDDIP